MAAGKMTCPMCGNRPAAPNLLTPAVASEFCEVCQRSMAGETAHAMRHADALYHFGKDPSGIFMREHGWSGVRAIARENYHRERRGTR